MVDDDRSGLPEKIRLVITNSFKTRIGLNWLSLGNEVANVRAVIVDSVVVGRVGDSVVVDGDQSGFPETIRLITTNSFKTRTGLNWLRLVRGEAANVRATLADNVNAIVVVDDDQSGFPETIRLNDNELLASWGSNYCIQGKDYTIE